MVFIFFRVGKLKENSKEKTARIYSSALYEAAASNSRLDAVKKDVDLLSQICVSDKDVIKRVSSPLLSEDERKSIWQQVAKVAKLSEETKNFLNILTENQRIGDLGVILQDFKHLYYANGNIAEIKVETVKELSAAQDKRLRSALEQKFGKNVVIEYVMNPALLGGLRIQSGSKMFDGSLSYKLNCLENLMKGK